ncbi:MAG: hypothetical protein IT424_06915 [Pirellulales bacterium]|nr:hypothetical protein [Pirellulales bacterium]
MAATRSATSLPPQPAVAIADTNITPIVDGAIAGSIQYRYIDARLY